MDREHPERTLVELTFDNDAFLATKDGGTTWTTLGAGTAPRGNTPHLRFAERLVGFADHGRLDEVRRCNAQVGARGIVCTRMRPRRRRRSTTKSKKGAAASEGPSGTQAGGTVMSAFLVNDMAFGHDTWYAATSGGVLESKDFGATWKSAVSKDAMLRKPAQSVEVSSDGNQVWALSERNLVLFRRQRCNLGWQRTFLRFRRQPEDSSAGRHDTLHHHEHGPLRFARCRPQLESPGSARPFVPIGCRFG